MPQQPTIGIRLTPEDLTLLDALVAREERNRSDIVRRAIRAYAGKSTAAPKTNKRPRK
jgi:metal-responsive CopG/Arc/MetJ family transcriptional regulator